MPDVKKYVTETLKKKSSEIPSCSLFQTVKEAVLNDSLLPLKLEFFIFLAGTVKPFLTRYQADQPLIVDLATDITCLLNDLMGLFIKPAVLQENSNGYKLANLDVKKKEHHLKSKNLSIGLATRQSLEGLSISPLQKRNFEQDCLTILTATVSKIQERSPLKYSFVRALKALDPRMISGSNEVTTSFSNITRKLVSANIMSSDQFDAAERQYKRMVGEKADDIKGFDATTQRPDQFYHHL